MEKEQREFRVDRLMVRRLRLQRGWNIDTFSEEAGINIGTAKKLCRGGPVSVTIIHLAAKAFGIVDHLVLLHPDELRNLGVDPGNQVSIKHVQEWEIGPYLAAWEKTANGLQFCVAKLQHRHLRARFARGKCYWLRHLTVSERDRMETQLHRHPEICEKIRGHPNIAENITATFVEEGGLWWVLDQWVDGPTLAEQLRAGPLEGAHLKMAMVGIAEGLHALHKAKIIRRELSPRFVILQGKDPCPVLTDFELAKLLGGKTVAPKDGWQDDPYRAIEVAGDRAGDLAVDERADIYSWGRIFVEAATGSLATKGDEAEHMMETAVPSAVKEIVLRCVAKPRSSRPGRIDEVLKILKRWTP